MTNNTSFLNRNAPLIKLIVLGILTLILLIPSSMIKNLIRERQYHQESVKTEISSKWGDAQTIIGPVIAIPYEYQVLEGKVVKNYVGQLIVLPNNLKINGNLDTQILKRGIYEMMAYRGTLQIFGNFSFDQAASILPSNATPNWDKAQFSIGISDLKGIKESIIMEMDSSELSLEPGITINNIMTNGVGNKLALNRLEPLNFSTTLELQGSESLYFIPVGKTTTAFLKSSCPNPSFDGNFLPENRKMDNNGFTADWKILHLNRNYPQQWLNSEHRISDSKFGLNLLLNVDHYQKTERSAKYAILFIALTFLTFFFIEILNAKRIHPIQYILIGLVLCVFYTLLLSLSEKLGFQWSYLIASLGVIGLITIYASASFSNFKLVSVLAGVLVVLYAFIYILLQLADYSLLFGSVGLFLFLAVLMISSRKINWYQLNNNQNS
jgi:inner membrane protein